MSYDAALTFFARTRGDDAGGVIRILCAIAAAADGARRVATGQPSCVRLFGRDAAR
jgi:hypothetical protein